MRFRTLAIAAALSAGFAPFKGLENPVVTPSRAPRAHRDIAWKAPAGVLATLPSAASWRVMWDRDTDVPVRLWGPAQVAPNTSADAGAAEAFARQQLATHLALLAPGATVADFTLLANVTDRAGLRTVSFAQHYNGLTVIGGTVAFTFGHDKLTMISSSALPHVNARMPGNTKSPDAVASAARTWLAADGHRVDIKAHGGRVVMPVIHARGNKSHVDIEYRVAEQLEAEASEGAGTWNVYMDAADLSPIARASTTYYATGRVLFDVPDRYPGGVRSPKAAPSAVHSVDGAMTMSDVAGTVTWASEVNAAVVPGLTGPLVKVTNKVGASATDALTLAPGGTVTWSRANEEYADSQLISFVAASTAKYFSKTRLNPDLAWLNSQIPVTVNEPQTCNAYSTGNAIHFYKAASSEGGLVCENTGRITDVVYHEFGHSLHDHSVIPGEGVWEGALSEGLADTLAQAITGDPGMGRGFFKTNAPLRNLNPVGKEKRWPDDVDGEVHDDGEIIGEALWDLRTGLEQQYGTEAGYETWLKLFYGVMQRSADIPTTYAAALITDDNDGDLSNGTPNMCQINTAFGAHGLADPSVSLGLGSPERDGFQIGIATHPQQLALDCPAPSIASGVLTWNVEGGPPTTIPLVGSTDNPDFWSANIATQPDGTVVRYSVSLELSDGTKVTYPQNAADPLYQFYVGNVEKVWCSDFENGLGEWTVGGSSASRVDWEVGAPVGIGGDPKLAFGGTNVLGTDLGTDDGLYNGRITQWAESPEIDLKGHTNVRLQYRRWLSVEDAAFDKATISANDQVVWTNFASASQDAAGINHTDKEWRFHDVDLSAQAATGKVKLKFALQADQGLELGGWNIDDVCIVMAGPPSATCGNHNVDEGESCDDGNTEDGDACPADCGTEDPGCGCNTGSTPAAPLALALLTLGFVVRRRKRV